MRRYVYISLISIAVSALFGLCYYWSFKSALLHYNKTAVEQNTELLNELLRYSGKSEEMLRQLLEEEEVAMETATSSEILRANASYFLETCYLRSQTEEREQLAIPGFMVGTTRKELLAYIEGYMESMPVNEYLAGLVSYEIVSFGADQVVLRKTYDEHKIENQFYLCNVGGFVVVYYSDLRTVYEYTEIQCNGLSQEVQLMLESGFYVKDARELYSILEGYTS